EVFARSESNTIVSIGAAAYAASPQPLYNDDTGQPVPDCATVPSGTPCDRYFYNLNIVAPQLFPPNGGATRFILNSRLTYLGDFYKKLSHACGATNLTVVPQPDYTFLRSVIVAHEVGHYLTLGHTAICSNVMFGSGGLMPDNTPYPTDYKSSEIGSMRTH